MKRYEVLDPRPENPLGRDAQGRGLRRCQKNAAWNLAYLEAMLSEND